MFLTNWIDKRFDYINSEPLFKECLGEIEMEEIDGTYYLLNVEKGIDIVLSDALVVQSIHLFSGHSDSKEYRGEIPLGLRFSMSKDIVNELLGDPNKRSSGYTDMFGRVPSWDKYLFEDYSLHVQYIED